MLETTIRRCAAVGIAATLLTTVACQHGHTAADPRTTTTLKGHAHALTLDQRIDRYTFFGPAGGPNMLHTRSTTDLPPPEDDRYAFRGGCYTWVAPQNAWINQRGEPQNWPPDPAMDRGPASILGRTHDSITTLTPVSRLGLRERKVFTLTPEGGTLTYELLNDGKEPIPVGAWINTAVTTADRIAIYMPEGTTLRGWDDDAVKKIESILSPPTGHGWRLLDLPRAGWQGGTKVWIDTPDGDATIAVWRHGRWLIRTMDRSDPDGTLAAVGEGPVAVYIDPTDNLIEAELYAPIEMIPPGGSSSVTEYWQMVPGRFRAPSPSDLVMPMR